MTSRSKIDSFFGENRFLSNFYPWPIVDENGVTWPSTEHYYQAMKTDVIEEREAIRSAPLYKKDCKDGQRTVKSLGRSCTMRPEWDSVKNQVMHKALRMKFKFNNKMGIKLVETGDAELIEGNTWDDVWFGVCNGVGLNHLGRLLMELREELKIQIEKNKIPDLF